MRLSSVRELKSEITADPRWRTARDEKGVHMAIGVTLGELIVLFGAARRTVPGDLHGAATPSSSVGH